MIEFLKKTLKISEDAALKLMIEIELEMSANQDNEYGSFYKVDIHLSEKGVKEGIMEKLEEENVDSLFKISDSHAVMFVETEENVYEIENAIGFFLEESLGTFEWKCLF